MRLVLLTGAHGAPLARALTDHVELVVVAPTTRDAWVTGLKRSPDLDALLADATEPTYGVADALDGIGFGATWHRADDAETARRIVRTELLHAGFSLTEATHAMAARLDLGHELLPLSDDRGELHVIVEDADGRRAVHLDEHTATGGEIGQVVLVSDAWTVSPAVTEAVSAADVVVVGPPDPVHGATVLGHAAGALDLAGTPVVEANDLDATALLARVGEATR